MPLHHWPNPRVPWRSFHNHWIVRLVLYVMVDLEQTYQETLAAGRYRPT